MSMSAYVPFSVNRVLIFIDYFTVVVSGEGKFRDGIPQTID